MHAEHLILVAHGAVDTPRSNQPIHDLASAVQAVGDFASVTPAFLNGAPQVTHVLETIEAEHGIDCRRVLVVPIMTSQGYYLKKLPGLFEQNRNFSQFDLHMTSVVGLHPQIPSLMFQRLQSQLDSLPDDHRDVEVIVIGHGTRRNSTSGQSTFDLVDQLANDLRNFDSHRSIHVCAGFLDQDPELASVFESRPSDAHVIALPFLVALGPHMTEDVPEALGLPTGPEIAFPLSKEQPGRRVICEQPLALYASLPSLVLELAFSAQTSEELA